MDTTPHLTYPTQEPPVPQASSSSSRPSGPPTVIAIHKDRLYVGNLHPTVDEYTLLQIFSKYGKISKLDFLFHKAGPQKGKPRGYAFVEYSAREDASQALINLHDKVVRGRKLVVTFAQQQSSSPLDGSLPASRPGGRKGTDTTRPTMLSLIKTHGRPNSTTDKIAALEAKLKQMQTPKTDGLNLSPKAATALGVLPPRPQRSFNQSSAAPQS
ncbi:hypothetical protein FRB94_005487 [Tulasnella sp. JGI-2019a]|nr:hypothetical protein FRB93_006115 [Tulasnella sp. JGI-2019a]KAG9000385.1 hypothetical protein FRB94_005487 [Tulasnella sp. JGI-2019a]KAG9029438.1 hypothetical protein FRB95_005331 [Tulasnella sp. JGI-2019a]